MEYNHFTYGAQLAEKHKSLSSAHYLTCSESDNLQSLMERMSNINTTALIALDGKNSDFSYNDSERLIKRPQYFFMVLMPAPLDDSAAILAAQTTSEAIALQIQARMMLDHRKYQNGLTCLMPETFTIRGIGPVGDNLFGVIMGFNVEEGIDFSLNADKWRL
jgi:hypothetical protein